MRHALKELVIELKLSAMLPDEIGVFAACDMRKGQKALVWGGREDDFLSHEEFALLSPGLQEKIRMFVYGRPGGYLVESGFDANHISVPYFVNHSCEGNLGFDDDGDHVALRDIARGEELLCDYGLVEANPDFSMACRCRAATCRGVITGLDWRDEEFRTRMGTYFHPDLKSEMGGDAALLARR